MKRSPRSARYVSADPADRWSRIALAENYRRMGQTDSAESVLEPLAPDDSEALVIRAQIAIDRQEQDRAERLLASGKNRRRQTGPAARQDGAFETRRSRRPSINSASHSRPTPTIAKPFSGWRAHSSWRTKPRPPSRYRELAGNLERLNTLVHRAANRTARKDPAPAARARGCVRAPCTATPKPALVRAGDRARPARLCVAAGPVIACASPVDRPHRLLGRCRRPVRVRFDS